MIISFSLMFQRMKAIKCPTDELSISNCAVINPNDFPDNVKYVSDDTCQGCDVMIVLIVYIVCYLVTICG